MKANELMIGDWISVMEIPAQVFELSYDNEEKEMTIGILDPQGEVYSCYYGYDHVEPIPLTVEILEKNGWERIVHSRTYIDSQKCVLGNYRDKKWHMAYGGLNDDYTRIQSIRYVHQLQQALRLCGISKTIEL